MTTFDFSPLFRSTIGFDTMTRLLEGTLGAEEMSSYPPYNIEKTGENRYRISMAIAGFGEDDVSIEVKENMLHVVGERKEDDRDRVYLHRGIAARAFRRQFQLADHVEVVGARLERGLLIIDLARELPEALKPRRIHISTGGPGKLVEGKKSAA
ncbi:MAG: Hsp20 family protein [Alphaproteobacteria bacterium]|nr:Hsp20 family protein [Alphaproteobacteria bacterium]